MRSQRVEWPGVEGSVVDCVAHRGFAGRHPENTVGAVRAAVAAGADAVEVDLRRCGSGEVVVIHDGTVDRVTDGTGAVADHSLETLRGLDVLGTGRGVPTLGAVLEVIPAGVRAVLELKERGVAADALDVAADHDADVTVSSFDVEALREARAVGTAPLALLFASDARAALDSARDLECGAVHPNRRLCDGAFVDRCHDAGFSVVAWTVSSAETARRLRGRGLDGVIVDDPDYC